MHAMLAGLESTLAADVAWSVGAREQAERAEAVLLARARELATA
jgi:hypothetical protein